MDGREHIWAGRRPVPDTLAHRPADLARVARPAPFEAANSDG